MLKSTYTIRICTVLISVSLGNKHILDLRAYSRLFTAWRLPAGLQGRLRHFNKHHWAVFMPELPTKYKRLSQQKLQFCSRRRWSCWFEMPILNHARRCLEWLQTLKWARLSCWKALALSICCQISSCFHAFGTAPVRQCFCTAFLHHVY